MKRILFLSLVLAISISCKKSEPDVSTTARDYSEIEKTNWLLGRWENNSKAGNLSEIWTKTNDSVYHGASYFVVGIDTVFSEHIELAQKNETVWYTVTVTGQNDDKPVTFQRISADPKSLTFENPKHDFPNKIVYNRVGDSLMAEISGTKDNKPSRERFAMIRVK